MAAYYNENDPYAAAWLRNLITSGLIASGDVDERSILDVRPGDLRGYQQCHFFAGIAGWSHALRLAGWPDEKPVWTGSCPCQPLSGAGQRKGHADERHLWPAFYRLIAECNPPIVFGEQVASKDGREWLAGVRADLEALGYACGAADLCAAGVSAPHNRPRLYWVADANTSKWQRFSDSERRQYNGTAAGWIEGDCEPKSCSSHPYGMGDANGYHRHWWSGPVQVGWNGFEAFIENGGRRYLAQWRVKPSLPVVAYGVPGRVGKLCAAGNAIVPQLAAEFICASEEALTSTAR